jgi:hypothetical protein
VATIASVTEVIEVIGYQLWRGVLWPYRAGRLGKDPSFNPENWIRRHIREAYQDDEPTLEISGIPVCQNGSIRNSPYELANTLTIRIRADHREITLV